MISEPAPIEVHALEQCDAWLGVSAPENTRDGADIPAERTSAVGEAYRDAGSRLHRQETPWVLCWYPTPALAQDAGMTLPAFADFLYGSCLIDWKSFARADLASGAALRRGRGSPDRRKTGRICGCLWLGGA